MMYLAIGSVIMAALAALVGGLIYYAKEEGELDIKVKADEAKDEVQKQINAIDAEPDDNPDAVADWLQHPKS